MTTREIQKEYQQLSKELKAAGVTLVAVSKTHPPEKIMELYELGHRDFGENRQPEMVEKYEALPKDIRWHFIGHLQRNKVKYIAPFVHLIHSADSIRLLREIEKQAARADRTVQCLLQFKIAEEDTKYGLDPASVDQDIQAELLASLPHLKIRGVMGMATFTEDMDQVRREFKRLKAVFDHLRGRQFRERADFDQVSMGMSGDYQVALEEGTTVVRIGSLLFGNFPG